MFGKEKPVIIANSVLLAKYQDLNIELSKALLTLRQQASDSKGAKTTLLFAYEKKKREILQNLETNIDRLTKTELEVFRNLLKKRKPKKKVNQGYRYKFIYYFLLIFAFFESATGGFLGIQEILALIPYITYPWLIALSAVITAFECFLFYACEFALLRTALKIETPYDEKSELLDCYRNQIEIVASLNQKISQIEILSTLSLQEYQTIHALLVYANADLKKLKSTLKKHQEPVSRKALRWFVIGFGALMTIGNTYFIGTALLTFCSPALVASPLGLIFLSFMIIARLALFFNTRGSA